MKAFDIARQFRVPSDHNCGCLAGSRGPELFFLQNRKNQDGSDQKTFSVTSKMNPTSIKPGKKQKLSLKTSKIQKLKQKGINLAQLTYADQGKNIPINQVAYIVKKCSYSQNGPQFGNHNERPSSQIAGLQAADIHNRHPFLLKKVASQTNLNIIGSKQANFLNECWKQQILFDKEESFQALYPHADNARTFKKHKNCISFSFGQIAHMQVIETLDRQGQRGLRTLRLDDKITRSENTQPLLKLKSAEQQKQTKTPKRRKNSDAMDLNSVSWTGTQLSKMMRYNQQVHSLTHIHDRSIVQSKHESEDEQELQSVILGHDWVESQDQDSFDKQAQTPSLMSPSSKQWAHTQASTVVRSLFSGDPANTTKLFLEKRQF